MAINQLGSVLYFVTLQNVDLTLSVPIANSLTFIFTAISGSYLEENLPSKSKLVSFYNFYKKTISRSEDKRGI